MVACTLRKRVMNWNLSLGFTELLHALYGADFKKFEKFS